jgi:homoserine dehydrogenase
MKPLNIAILGLGTVGGGTFDVLTRNAEEISRRAGRGIFTPLMRLIARARDQAHERGEYPRHVTR